MMPGMDGIEASSQIRHQDRSIAGKWVDETPIIALTANAVVGMKEVFQQNGMNDCLSKPIELSKLHSILATWLPKDKLEIIMDSSDRSSLKKKEKTPIFISGVNTEAGLLQTGGTLEKYLRVLTALCADMETKLNLMHTALDEENVKLYKTYVHGFKSVLATIGALPLSATAAALEVAANQNDLDYIVHHNDAFMQELKIIYQSITVFLNSQVSSPACEIPGEEMNFLKSELLRLKAAVCDMKPKTIDEILDGLFAKNWDKEIHGKLEEISQNILIFEWDNAVTLIDDIVGN
jgi:CheY-like chemotaxis protein